MSSDLGVTVKRNDDFSKWFDSLGYENMAEDVRTMRGSPKKVRKSLMSLLGNDIIKIPF